MTQDFKVAPPFFTLPSKKTLHQIPHIHTGMSAVCKLASFSLPDQLLEAPV